MKVNFSVQNNRGVTVVEALVVFACVLVLMAVILPHPRHHGGINCVSNLKQVNLSFRIWAGDTGDQYPMSVSVTNGGAMELIETGNLGCLELLSNEMCTPKIFVCPADQDRTFATNWNVFNGSHISYFISADVSNEDIPNMVLDGDDNLIIGGLRVKSGIWALSSNLPASWSGTRHVHAGNIGLADGSVIQLNSDGLQQAFQRTGLAKNRIVIP